MAVGKILSEGSGPLDASLWVIGESYGQEELNETSKHGVSSPFVGAAGRRLRKALRDAQISESEVRFENLICEKPPGNKFEFFERSENEGRLFASIERLRDRIHEGKPNILICVGKYPLKYIGGKNVPITKWRGHMFWSEEFNLKILATFHPSYCIRNNYGVQAGIPGALFDIDFRKAAKERHTSQLGFEEFECIINPDYKTAKESLEYILHDSDITSYDIECFKGAGYTFMDCIGLSMTRSKAICIPFWVSHPKSLPKRYWLDPKQEHVIYSLIKEILEGEIPKVAQNSQFDTVILGTYYDIGVNNLVWDTMVAHHSLYCDFPADLGTLISLYTNLPYQKYLIQSAKLSDRYEYNCADCIATLHVMEGEIKECQEIEESYGVNPLKHLRAIPLPAITMLAEMQMDGVLVDSQLRESALTQELQLQEDILDALDEVLPYSFSADKKYPHKFKPNSGADRKKLFIDCLGCKKYYGDGIGLSFDKTVMGKYQKDSRIYVRELAKAIHMYKESTVISGRLKAPLRNGRLHTKYGIGGRSEIDDKDLGTHTGRLNSKKSDIVTYDTETEKWVSCGTNLQNLSKGLLRRMIVPDPGEEFCLIDLWAAEAYTTALDAGEDHMLSLLDNGVKIHEWVQNWIKEKHTRAYDETFKGNDKAGYHKAKQCVHALNYGVMPDKLSKETGLSVEVCSAIYAHYHSTFPNIRLRMERITTEVRTTRSLISILGRRRIFVAPESPQLLRHAFAWPMQSLIGELTILGMLKVWRSGKPHGIIPALNTHDGIAIRIPKKGCWKDDARLIVQNAFDLPLTKGAITIRIPVEIGFGKNFNDIEDVEILRYTGVK